MAEYSSNIELAQEISARIGTEPIPFESVSGLCMQIYQELGGDMNNFNDVYSILLETLPLAEQGGAGLIDDTVISSGKTWSSSKINTELNNKQNTLTAGQNIVITNNTINTEGYTYNPTTGAFTEGDRDIVDSGTTYIKSTATGLMAHAEGSNTNAIGRASHAEGNGGSATGIQSHAEGSSTEAKGTNSHTEGRLSVTNGYSSHAEGDGAETGGNYASATTNTKTPDSRTAAAGDYAHAEGLATIAYGIASHAEGRLTFAKGDQSHAEGNETISNGVNSHTEGRLTKTNGSASNSHTEGYLTETGGNYTSNTKTAGVATDAGAYAHAEGNATIANGVAAHSEGKLTLAKGERSHAEGENTVATGVNAHAENYAQLAEGNNSHAEGRRTKTLCNSEHAQGSFNVSHRASTVFDGNVGNTLHSIGIGTADNARKNAVEVMQSGQVYLIGVGNYDGIHIKGETGAPSGLQTLQEVVRGLKNISITLSDNTTKTYQVKEGMTWFDWVSSDLNTDGFVVKQYAIAGGYEGFAVFESANSSYHLGFIFNGVSGGDYVPAAHTISTSLSYYFYD